MGVILALYCDLNNHACDFHTHACDFHTNASNFLTHACDLNTHACDFDTLRVKLLYYKIYINLSAYLRPVTGNHDKTENEILSSITL
jgi:hypothetical protein